METPPRLKTINKMYGFGIENYNTDQVNAFYNAMKLLLSTCGSVELSSIAKMLEQLSDNPAQRSDLLDELESAGY